MAKSRVKAGGCRKGRRRRHLMGMNSGKELAKRRECDKKQAQAR